MENLVCLQDFEREALDRLDKNAGDYFKSGSDDEITLKRNLESYNNWLIKPRMLRDVRNMNLRRLVQGKPVAFPVGFSPAGFQGLAHCEGEVASAQAASDMGTIFVLSTYSTRSIEEIAEACPEGRRWFQLFPNSSPDVTRDLVRRAECAGYEAIVVTLDAQNFGNKRRTARSGLYFPPQLRLANFTDYVKHTEMGSSSKSHPSSDDDDDINDIAGHVHRSLAQDLTWDVVPFLRRHTKLPLILKGILRSEDAEMAIHHKVDGIWISNHGGRQVDTVAQPIDVLCNIAKVVRGRIEIFIDSGIRKGSDVFKALALGATMLQSRAGQLTPVNGIIAENLMYAELRYASLKKISKVFVGRPQIWGIAVNGDKGARRVLEIMKDELELTMALSGVADVEKITKEYVCTITEQFYQAAVAKL